MRIGTPELLLILLIVVIVFGPTQIPKLSQILGKGVRGFRQGLEMDEDDTSKPRNGEQRTESQDIKKAYSTQDASGQEAGNETQQR